MPTLLRALARLSVRSMFERGLLTPWLRPGKTQGSDAAACPSTTPVGVDSPAIPPRSGVMPQATRLWEIAIPALIAAAVALLFLPIVEAAKRWLSRLGWAAQEGWKAQARPVTQAFSTPFTR